MQEFCPEGKITNPKCYTLETIDFLSEENIFDILLDFLKSELPPRLKLLTDCSGKPMYIHEEDIDLVMSDREPHFEVILNPISVRPTYTDNRIHRTVEYDFDLILTVHNEDTKCLTWELLRLKNVVEGLIVAVELVIDGYNAVDVEPKGFEYFLPEQVGKTVYMRQGTYRFTVTVIQYKNN
jgi:hypothetical protein